MKFDPKSLDVDSRDPSPWIALYLDQSIPIPEETKAALLKGMSSSSRQFLLPIIRPLAWTALVLLQIFKILVPNRFHSSRILHYLIYLGLKYFVSPEANYLILRHFHLGSEILQFIRDNTLVSGDFSLEPLKPLRLEDVKDDLFLKHDLNLYNFIIRLNQKLRTGECRLKKVEKPNFIGITDRPIQFETLPNRWTNILDVESAIEIYTPMYQAFLTDNDFWRAANSLQLDETIGIYVSRILGDSQYLWLINNKHPLIPLSTLRAGHRLTIHGIASESLHGLLSKLKASVEQGNAGEVR
jgi:hypothetical protein